MYDEQNRKRERERESESQNSFSSLNGIYYLEFIYIDYLII